MSINDLLTMELEAEIPATRKMLERVPATPDFTPHEKSMTLGKLAPHVAQIPWLGLMILTRPSVDVGKEKREPLALESGAQLVSVFDKGIAEIKAALAAVPEKGWEEPWKMEWNGMTLFEGPRFVAYRQMFMNHLVHHRAQLGTYLRQSGVPVPRTYGPSADER